MPNSRSMWLVVVVTAIFLGAAFVTLRAAATVGNGGNGGNAVPRPSPAIEQLPAAHQAQPATAHPPASAPEESATIADDPTTAPDAAQSADKNVSFPTDI